jgi:hypothetical protein
VCPISLLKLDFVAYIASMQPPDISRNTPAGTPESNVGVSLHGKAMVARPSTRQKITKRQFQMPPPKSVKLNRVVSPNKSSPEEISSYHYEHPYTYQG